MTDMEQQGEGLGKKWLRLVFGLHFIFGSTINIE